MYRPWTNRYCGIEMEMVEGGVSIDSLATTVALGLNCVAGNTEDLGERRGYFHSDGSTWDVKTDSTCGYEIVTPAFKFDEQGHYPQLREVLREVNGLGMRVSNSCGVHVHVEVTDYDWHDLQNLMRLWIRYEPFFFELVPRNRSTNSYCRPWRAARNGWGVHLNSAFAPIMNARSQVAFNTAARHAGRYMSLNLSGWWRSQRVEFRLHSGSLDYDKIRAWAMLMLSVVQRVKEGGMPGIDPLGIPSAQPLSTSYVMKSLGLLPSSIRQDVSQEAIELAAWVNARRQQFADRGPRRVRQTMPERRVPGSPLIDLALATTNMCAAQGANCTNPRAGSRLLCQPHMDDFINGRGYLIGARS